MKQLIIIFLAGLLVFSGCSLFKPKKEKTAQELADKGMAEYSDKNYRVAIDTFSDLKNWYPFSKYAILADLKIADSYYELEEYDEAVHAYSEFENLHPRNEAVPEVVYKTGLCYFNQIDTIDRDQSNASKALNTFNRLLQQFPDSEFSDKARENKKKCLEGIAGHELYVGKFYFKSEHYKAAQARFENVVSSYPGTRAFEEAVKYVAECKALLKNDKTADR